MLVGMTLYGLAALHCRACVASSGAEMDSINTKPTEHRFQGHAISQPDPLWMQYFWARSIILRGAVHRSNHGTNVLGISDYLHFTEFLTIRRHPIQKRLATFTAILYPTAIPMIQVEPIDLGYHLKGKSQSGHQPWKDEAATAKSSAKEEVQDKISSLE